MNQKKEHPIFNVSDIVHIKIILLKLHLNKRFEMILLLEIIIIVSLVGGGGADLITY